MKPKRLSSTSLSSPSKGQKTSLLAPAALEMEGNGKLYCLFCYKLAFRQATGDDEAKKTPEERDVEYVSRMGICGRFYCEVMINSSSETGQDETKWRLRDNHCGVCDDCLYLIENHCKIYEEIENLKLRLRWQLEQFYKVMKYAGKVPSRVKAFKENFRNGVGAGADDILTTRLKDFDKVMELRQRIYDACFKRLKVKNPKVSLETLKCPLVETTPVSTKITGARDSNCSERNVPEVPDQPEPVQSLSQVNTDENFNPNENEDSNEVMYIIKTEGGSSDGGDNFQKIVAPPESILETLRSGKVPLEGVSKSHYFYCTSPPTPTTCDEDMGNDDAAVNTFANEERPVRRQNLDVPSDKIGAGNNLDKRSLPLNPTTFYKCIKCDETFPSEETLIFHAMKGSCFTDENINLDCSTSSNYDHENSSKSKRKRSSEDNVTNQNESKRMHIASPPKDKIKRGTNNPSGGNIVANAIDKALAGLRSIFKCPNCSVTFHSEENFKGHILSRECFREIKKRSSSKMNGGNQKKENFSDDEQSDSDVSSLSASSHEDNSDSDYAPKCQKKAKRSKSNSSRNRRRSCAMKDKEITKTSCPRENCNKFFLYKADLERHLKQHDHISCKFCNFTSDRPSELVDHEVRMHSKKNIDNRVMCPRCPDSKTLSSDKHHQTDHYMRRHLSAVTKEKHKDVRTQCKICGAVLRAKTSSLVEHSLSRHMANVHKK